MNRQKRNLAVIVLLLIGSTASLLAFRQQTPGAPGVAFQPLPGLGAKDIRVQVKLPERVLSYTSELLPQDEITTNTLPPDTSYGQRVYRQQDPPFTIVTRVVLMGTERTSLHRPELCFRGQGWRIDSQVPITVRMERPIPYDLPVVKMIATQELNVNGQRTVARGVYLYWYVAEDAVSASVSGLQRMWLLAKKMLTTGKLQRWAYVSCFAQCAPGQEDAACERVKEFIAASVPEFQVFPRTAKEAATIRP